MRFQMRGGEHLVRDTEFARYVREHLRDEQLFTCYNAVTKRWFLGLWLNKDAGVAQDVEDLGVNLELANRNLVKDLERSREGITADDMKRSIMRAEKRAIERQNQEAIEFQEAANWLQKKSGSDVPVLMG